MRQRLRGLTERDWRTLDRLLVAGLIVIATVDLSTNSHIEGPLWLNLLLIILIALSFLWRRTQPLIPVACVFVGMSAMAIWLTEPPNMFVAVLILVTLGYAAGRHLAGRVSTVALGIGVVVMVILAAVYDPNDIIFPVTFFWILPWLAGRTLRNQTRLARELAEKAERAQHVREEDERRAIMAERNRIARELHDVLAHNLSVMVVQAAGAPAGAREEPGARRGGRRPDRAHRA